MHNREEGAAPKTFNAITTDILPGVYLAQTSESVIDVDQDITPVEINMHVDNNGQAINVGLWRDGHESMELPFTCERTGDYGFRIGVYLPVSMVRMIAEGYRLEMAKELAHVKREIDEAATVFVEIKKQRETQLHNLEYAIKEAKYAHETECGRVDAIDAKIVAKHGEIERLDKELAELRERCNTRTTQLNTTMHCHRAGAGCGCGAASERSPCKCSGKGKRSES